MTMPDHEPDRARGGNGQYVRTAEGAQRDAEACRLRSRNHTYQEIGDLLFNGSASNARRAVERTLAETVREPADELRQLMLMRLEEQSRKMQDIADRKHLLVSQGRLMLDLDGEPIIDPAPVIAAVDRLLKIDERRAKLLGLDAPVQVSTETKVHHILEGVDLDKL